MLFCLRAKKTYKMRPQFYLKRHRLKYVMPDTLKRSLTISTNLFCVNPESFLVQNTVVQKANYFHEQKYLSVEVVICRQQQILNLTNQRSLFMTVRNIFEISDDDHPSLVTHARDI